MCSESLVLREFALFLVFWKVSGFSVGGGGGCSGFWGDVKGFLGGCSGFLGYSVMFQDVPVFLKILHAISIKYFRSRAIGLNASRDRIYPS